MCHQHYPKLPIANSHFPVHRTRLIQYTYSSNDITPGEEGSIRTPSPWRACRAPIKSDDGRRDGHYLRVLYLSQNTVIKDGTRVFLVHAKITTVKKTSLRSGKNLIKDRSRNRKRIRALKPATCWIGVIFSRKVGLFWDFYVKLAFFEVYTVSYS